MRRVDLEGNVDLKDEVAWCSDMFYRVIQGPDTRGEIRKETGDKQWPNN